MVANSLRMLKIRRNCDCVTECGYNVYMDNTWNESVFILRMHEN